jgi:hypothetical protein
VGHNQGWVSVGIDHDTAEFATDSILSWWKHMGCKVYPETTELLIMADAGGSNSNRSRLWKVGMQRLANLTGLHIHVSHFPPGTSKWNKIEHRMFSFITLNWRGRPLVSYETIVHLIGNTKTRTGLKIKAKLTRRKYPKGIKISKSLTQKWPSSTSYQQIFMVTGTIHFYLGTTRIAQLIQTRDLTFLPMTRWASPLSEGRRTARGGESTNCQSEADKESLGSITPLLRQQRSECSDRAL